jgi:hypothetical protein
MSGLPAPVAYRKAIRGASLPWNQRLEQRAAASTITLDRPAACLNSRRFHPVRLIEAQPLHDWGQVLWNRPALVRAEFPPRPIGKWRITNLRALFSRFPSCGKGDTEKGTEKGT